MVLPPPGDGDDDGLDGELPEVWAAGGGRLSLETHDEDGAGDGFSLDRLGSWLLPMWNFLKMCFIPLLQFLSPPILSLTFTEFTSSMNFHFLSLKPRILPASLSSSNLASKFSLLVSRSSLSLASFLLFLVPTVRGNKLGGKIN